MEDFALLGVGGGEGDGVAVYFGEPDVEGLFYVGEGFADLGGGGDLAGAGGGEGAEGRDHGADDGKHSHDNAQFHKGCPTGTAAGVRLTHNGSLLSKKIGRGTRHPDGAECLGF